MILLQLPLAIGTGTLLLTSVLPVDSDLLKWSGGLIVGGGTAAVVQGGSVLTRLGSSNSGKDYSGPDLKLSVCY